MFSPLLLITLPAIVAQAQTATDSQTPIAELKFTIQILAALSTIGVFAYIASFFYHYRPVNTLLATIEQLQTKLQQQQTYSAQTDQIRTSNEKLQTRIEQLQTELSFALQEKEEEKQAIIEKLKNQLQILELENKRLSGVIMLKERSQKKM